MMTQWPVPAVPPISRNRPTDDSQEIGATNNRPRNNGSKRQALAIFETVTQKINLNYVGEYRNAGNETIRMYFALDQRVTEADIRKMDSLEGYFILPRRNKRSAALSDSEHLPQMDEVFQFTISALPAYRFFGRIGRVIYHPHASRNAVLFDLYNITAQPVYT